MKKISAVICELNPLHDGHRHIFGEAKKCSDVLIAIMSGNFVQRGETAVYDKYKRAQSAISAGADIVFELPFPFSSSSAEYFARAGVHIAESVGADTLYFGSECGDVEILRKCAEVMNSEEYRRAMTIGRSAALRSLYLKENIPDLPPSVLESPNDILGVEYCRFASIDTVAVKRISTESASLIRMRRLKDDNSDMLDPTRLFQLEYNKFRTQRSVDLDIAECTGGVGERLYNTAFKASNYSEWIEAVKTKQYTNARLRRAALFYLCGVSEDDIREKPYFTRLLAVNSNGIDYLSDIKKCCDFPIITSSRERKNLSEKALKQYLLSEFADTVYSLCLGETDPCLFSRIPPVINR